MCLRCCGCIPAWYRSIAFPYGHVGHRRTHSTMTLAVCVCCLRRASRCGCRPASGMSTQSRCRAWYTARCQWCRDPLGNNGSARLCVAIAVVGAQWLPQRIGEAREDEGTSWWYLLVHLRRCGGGLLRPEGWCRMTTHPSDSCYPDCSPDRNACTLSTPSAILRCGFGKGASLIAAEPLS